MRILKEDLSEIVGLLRVMSGYSWIALPENADTLKPEELIFFSTLKEAKEYSKEDSSLTIALLEPFAQLCAKNTGPELQLDIKELVALNEHGIINREKAELLNEKLQHWGVEDDLTKGLEIFIANCPEPFGVESTNLQSAVKESYYLNIAQDIEGNFHIDSFIYESKKDIHVLAVVDEQTSSRDLDKLMGSIDWNRVDPWAQPWLRRKNTDPEQAYLHDKIETITAQMQLLGKNRKRSISSRRTKSKALVRHTR